MSTPQWRKENKEKMLSYRRKYYNKNKNKFSSYRIKDRNRKRKWFSKYKLKIKCEKCGETHPATLQFHHIDPTKKEGNIGALTRNGWSINKIKEEIRKCKVFCANCHLKFHWEENNFGSHKES